MAMSKTFQLSRIKEVIGAIDLVKAMQVLS
jgi:hypothetical protein